MLERSGTRNLGRFLGVAAGALLVAGCALTPKPFTTEERWSEVQSDKEAMFADQEPITRPLTLNEAFARALKYNLDGRVKAMEEALSVNDLDLSRYDLLPKVAVDGMGTTRNRFDASSSESIQTRQQSLVPSTSSDLNRFTGDLTLSWNILDFGVSYFAARQEADRVLIAQEERRKAVQTLLQDVRRAYWRAAAAQRLTNDVKAAIRAAEDALPAARKVETEGLKSPIDSLRYQKALLDAICQLETNEQLLAISKDELASLINLPPGEPYTIAVPSEASMRLEAMKIPVGQMESTALLLNPDIRGLSYEARISVAETRKALLKLLPGITLSADPNVDSNSFLVHHYWVAGAARVNGYLSNLLTAPIVIPQRENAEKLAVLKRQAMSMAILAKLHIAYQQYFAVHQGIFPSEAALFRGSAPLHADRQSHRDGRPRRSGTDLGASERGRFEAAAVPKLCGGARGARKALFHRRRRLPAPGCRDAQRCRAGQCDPANEHRSCAQGQRGYFERSGERAGLERIASRGRRFRGRGEAGYAEGEGA